MLACLFTSWVSRKQALLLLVSGIILSILFLTGCTFWVKDPQGRVLQVTRPDQEVITFLNQFDAGVKQLHAIFEALNEAQLKGLLISVNTAFQQLNNCISKNSPAHPANFSDLREKTMMLTQGIEKRLAAERNPYRRSQLERALAEAKELQGLMDTFLFMVLDP